MGLWKIRLVKREGSARPSGESQNYGPFAHARGQAETSRYGKYAIRCRTTQSFLGGVPIVDKSLKKRYAVQLTLLPRGRSN